MPTTGERFQDVVAVGEASKLSRLFERYGITVEANLGDFRDSGTVADLTDDTAEPGTPHWQL
jgi:hypothetical protein